MDAEGADGEGLGQKCKQLTLVEAAAPFPHQAPPREEQKLPPSRKGQPCSTREEGLRVPQDYMAEDCGKVQDGDQITSLAENSSS